MANYKYYICLLVSIFALACVGEDEPLGLSPRDNLPGAAGAGHAGGGSGGSSGSGDIVCIPGRQVACACPGGAQGAQACNADGKSYGPCFCPSGTGGVGGASGSAGVAGTAGTTGCQPQIIAEWISHATALVCPGTVAVPTLTVKLTAKCTDMEVKKMAFQLLAPDFADNDQTPFCKAPCKSLEDWYFRNLRLVTNESQAIQTIMGPAEFKAVTTNAPAYVQFTDSFSLKMGEVKILTFILDVASSFASPLPETRYRAILNGVDVGNGNIPYVSAPNVDLVKSVKVKNACKKALKVELAPDTPQSQIVVQSKWYTFTKYVVSNEGDAPLTLGDLTLEQTSVNGDMADFVWIMVEVRDQDGKYVWLDKDTMAGYSHGKPDDIISNPAKGSLSTWAPYVLKPGEKHFFTLRGYMANVQASSSVGGKWFGATRSGHTPALAITDLKTSNGVVTAYVKPHVASSMVLRKSKPTVTKLPTSSVLVNGSSWTDVYKWQVTPDVAGSVAVYQFVFNVSLSPGTQLCNFVMWDGLTQRSASIRQNSAGGAGWYTDLTSKCLAPLGGQVVITLHSEDVLLGSGKVYTLRATAAQVAPGATIKAAFVQTGKLITTYLPCGGPPVLGIGGEYLNLPGLIWSDMSELPHKGIHYQHHPGNPLPACFTSKDWIADAFLEDLSQVQVLKAP